MNLKKSYVEKYGYERVVTDRNSPLTYTELDFLMLADGQSYTIDEKGKVDSWQCAAYYAGANMSKNPFMPPEAYADLENREAIIKGEAKLDRKAAEEVIDRTFFYPPIKHGYISSICGRACDRACYIHLEKQGKLKTAFKSEFRKREDWKLPINIK